MVVPGLSRRATIADKDGLMKTNDRSCRSGLPQAGPIASLPIGPKEFTAVEPRQSFVFLKTLRLLHRLKGSSLVAVISLLTAITSFITHWYILYRFGAGEESAAFFAAIVPPVMVYEILALTFSMVLVPLLAPLAPASRRCATWSWVLALTTGMVLPCLLLITLAPTLVQLCFPGFSAETAAITTQLFIPISVTLLPLAGVEILGSGLRSSQRFVLPEILSWTASIISLCFLWQTCDRWGIYSASFAFLLRATCEFLLLAFWYRPTWPRWSSLQFLLVISRVKHLIVGSCVHRTDSLFDRYLTSFGAPHAVSLLALSRQIIHTSSRLLTRSITWTSIPKLSQHADAKEWRPFQSILQTRLLSLLIMSGLGISVMFFLGPIVIPKIFQHGRVTAADSQEILYFLLALCGTLIGESIANLYSNAFYAYGNTSRPTRIHIACYFLGLVIRAGAFFMYGVIGTAIGLSLYYLLFAATLMWQMHRTLKKDDLKPQTLKETTPMTLAAQDHAHGA